MDLVKINAHGNTTMNVGTKIDLSSVFCFSRLTYLQNDLGVRSACVLPDVGGSGWADALFVRKPFLVKPDS